MAKKIKVEVAEDGTLIEPEAKKGKIYDYSGRHHSVEVKSSPTIDEAVKEVVAKASTLSPSKKVELARILGPAVEEAEVKAKEREKKPESAQRAKTKEEAFVLGLTDGGKDELVGGREIARLMGISIARVYQLINDPGAHFPKHAHKTKTGRLWLKSRILQYDKDRPTRSYRRKS